MKTVFVILALMVCSCHHQTYQSSNSRQVTGYSQFNSLASALRVKTGVVVFGNGPTAKVYLQRNTTTRKTPLFLLNNYPLGTDYQSANRAIDMTTVETITVLDRSADLVTYGEIASGGVIAITTKS